MLNYHLDAKKLLQVEIVNNVVKDIMLKREFVLSMMKIARNTLGLIVKAIGTPLGLKEDHKHANAVRKASMLTLKAFV